MPSSPITINPCSRPVPSTLTRLRAVKKTAPAMAAVFSTQGPAPGARISASVPMPIRAKAAFSPMAHQLISPATVPMYAPRLRSTTK